MAINNKAVEKFDSVLTETVLNIIEKTNTDMMSWERGFIPFLPKNAITGKYYRGANVLALGDFILSSGSKFNKIVTFKQASDNKVKINKGVHGGKFAKYVDYKKYLNAEEKAELATWQLKYLQSDDKGEFLLIPTLKEYTGFTLEQTDNEKKLNELNKDDTENLTNQCDLDVIVKTLLEKSGAKVHYGLICQGLCPHYAHSENFIDGKLIINDIYLPDPKQITNSSIYNGIAIHELAHWTRCNVRDLQRKNSKNKNEYAFEELIAECSSALFCARFGIVKAFSNHSIYIKDWASYIKNDVTAIRRAMQTAQKIVNYFCELLGVNFDDCNINRVVETLKNANTANKPAEKKPAEKKTTAKVKAESKKGVEGLITDINDALKTGKKTVTIKPDFEAA